MPKCKSLTTGNLEANEGKISDPKKMCETSNAYLYEYTQNIIDSIDECNIDFPARSHRNSNIMVFCKATDSENISSIKNLKINERKRA